jgi:hypothetical protein
MTLGVLILMFLLVMAVLSKKLFWWMLTVGMALILVGFHMAGNWNNY